MFRSQLFDHLQGAVFRVTCQINNLKTQINREVVTALSTEDGPLKMVKTIVTEICRVLMTYLTNIFNNLVL